MRKAVELQPGLSGGHRILSAVRTRDNNQPGGDRKVIARSRVTAVRRPHREAGAPYAMLGRILSAGSRDGSSVAYPLAPHDESTPRICTAGDDDPAVVVGAPVKPSEDRVVPEKGIPAIVMTPAPPVPVRAAVIPIRGANIAPSATIVVEPCTFERGIAGAAPYAFTGLCAAPE